MDQKTLLLATERAAGQELLPMHERLIKCQIEERKEEDSIERYKDDINNLKAKNAGLERDVQRLLERDQLKNVMKLTETRLIVAK